MKQSWYYVYVYSEKELIATGRVVSDGVINAYLCGLGVNTNFRSQVIGTEISRKIVKLCTENNFHTQFFVKRI